MSLWQLHRMASLGLLLAATLSWAMSAAAQIERISVGDGDVQSNADSYEAAISDDGQVVAFRSTASNLIANDDHDWPDIFVRDLGTATTEMVSNQSGIVSRYSFEPSITDDGQVVVMRTDLEAPPFLSHIIAYDRTTVVSTFITSYGGSARQSPFVSGNGRYVAFFSIGTLVDIEPPEARPIDDDRNNTTDSYVFNRLVDPVLPLERISRDAAGNEGNGDTLSPTLSDDGRFVAFYSYAMNLVPGDDNDHEDIFVKDRQTAGIVMASVASDGTIGNDDSYKPQMSGNGKFVAFRSRASNLVNGDTNQHWDIFVHDLTASTTERVSVSSNDEEGNHDSMEADISDDGRFLVFRSNASNLVSGDTNQRFDIFVHDRFTGQTARVSSPDSGESNGHSYKPAISGNGAWIVFESNATNLVAGDTNQARDIFRVDNPLLGAP